MLKKENDWIIIDNKKGLNLQNFSNSSTVSSLTKDLINKPINSNFY